MSIQLKLIMGCALLTGVLTSMAADPSKAIDPNNPAWSFVPEVVATVDNQKITKKELFAEITRTLPNWHQDNVDKETREVVAKSCTNDLIDKILLRKMLAKANITPSPEFVKKEFELLYGKLNAKERKDFNANLKKNGLTLDAYLDNYSKDPKAQLGLAVNRFIEEKYKDKVNITQQEVEKYYRENPKLFAKPESVTASHILIKSDKIGDQKAKDIAQTILAQLKQGADFAEMAKKHSDCPSKERGGDLGSFSKGRMVPQFDNAAFKLKSGELSDVVKTQHGYHIIKVTKHEKAGTRSLSEVTPFLSNYLKQKKQGELLQTLLEKARLQDKVKVFIQ